MRNAARLYWSAFIGLFNGVCTGRLPVITNEFLTGYDSNSKETTKTAPLRVVTFNIWLSGAKEVESDSMISNLSNGWANHGLELGILAEIILILAYSLDTRFCKTNWWNYTSYGPYAAQNKMVTKAEQIYKGEKTADGKAFSLDAEKKGHPLFVAGDFNCPSHQDWTEETKHLHGDWVFEWPVTKLLTGIGMVDSFRQLHPNVSEVPGYTWSTVQKSSGSEWDYSIPEPQDRLDFIFYKGSQNNIKPVKSFTYSGNAADPLKAIPNQYENNYPSDHFIVLTDFEFVVNKGLNLTGMNVVVG
uniref:Endonuclease/exonuclease/phosphatase domain-containing protein n=1 Tax=Ditylenchus dipsaci TaxID=166011 RepID=A0A915CYE8_9BILA